MREFELQDTRHQPKAMTSLLLARQRAKNNIHDPRAWQERNAR
jgi:hypothetical protein